MRKIRASTRRARGQSALWAAAVAVSLCGTAAGQTLNLDAPTAPPPGAGEASFELADRMDAQITAIERARAAGADASLELRRGVRVLARNLLRAGEQAGEAGSAQVIAGRTLALRGEALDLRLRAKATQLAEPIVAEIVARCNVAPERLPSDADTLWRFLRDALAPLVESAPPMVERVTYDGGLAGELVGPRPLVPPAEDLAAAARAANLPANVVDACAALEAVLGAAANWPAYQRSAVSMRANATEALWLLGSQPASGVSVEGRRVLGDRFAAAVGKVCSQREPGALPQAGDSADLGGRTLRVMALAARCLDLASRCEPPAIGGAVRDAIVQVVVGRDPRTNLPTDPSRDASVAQRLARVEMVLRMIVPPGTRRELVSQGDVVRQIRPALRPLEESRRQAASELLEVAPRAVFSPDVAADPGFLAAVTSYRRRLDDLLIAEAVTRRLGVRPGRPNGSLGDWALMPRYEAMGDRLLVIAKGLTSAKEHDEALDVWRELGSVVEVLEAIDAEDELRRAAADGHHPLAEHLRVVSGGKGRELVDRLDEARSAWLGEARKARRLRSDPLAVASGRVVAAAGAATMAVEWARVRAALASSSPGAAAADAGSVLGSWELSSQAATLLVAVEMRTVSAALGLAAEGKHDEFLSFSRQAPGSQVRSLVVDVAARAGRLGARALTDGASDVLRQIATGAADPDREDPLGLRAELMSMSRYLEELASAGRRGDSRTEAELMAYLNTRAAAVRATVERWR